MLRGQKVAKGVWGAQRNGIWEPQTLPFSLSKQASARPWGLMHVCRSGRERVRGRAAGWREYHGGRDAYITDLVLGLLDSLEFRCVCHYAEAFALVLLKLLLVAHLEDRSRRKTKVKPWGGERGPQPVSTSEAATSQERDPGQESSCSGIYSHDPTQSRRLNQKVLD